MDRLSRIVAKGGLAVLLVSTVSSLGCRSMKNEIPPGKPYSTTGQPTTPNVGFTSDPRPDASAGAGLYNGIQQTSGANGIPGSVQQAAGNAVGSDLGGQPQYGTPINNRNLYNDGLPTGGKYGPPGTSYLPPSNSGPTQAEPADATSSASQSDTPLRGQLGVDLP